MSSHHAFAKILHREHAHYHSGLVANQQVANISREELQGMQIIKIRNLKTRLRKYKNFYPKIV